MATTRAADSSTYRHQAIPYAGHDEFVQRATRFFSDGVSAGEPGLLLTCQERLDDVRDSLGDLARDLEFLDVDVVGRNPALIFSVFDGFANAHAGRRVRGWSEPVNAAWTSARRAEAGLHELLLNAEPCRKWDMWLGCPYDTTTLDDAALAAVRASHPDDGSDLATVARAEFESPLPPRPPEADTIPVDAADLAALREMVRTAARMSGLDDERAEGLVCAVNEVVTNGMRHGRRPVDVALWSADGALVCDVHDRGRLQDPFAGRVAPVLGAVGGRGLWLANHLCDLMQVRAPASGTSVRMYIAP